MNLIAFIQGKGRKDMPYAWPKPLWKKVLFFPLDLLFFHLDLLRNLWELLRWLCFTKPSCFYCTSTINSGQEIKRNDPASRYTNLWLARLLCPCTQPPDGETCSVPFCAAKKRKRLHILPIGLVTLLVWTGAALATASYPPARRLARSIMPNQTTRQLKRLVRPTMKNPMERARTLVSEKNYMEARIAFMNAVRVDPSNGVLRAEFADTLLELKLWGQALKELQATAILQPTNHVAVSKFVTLSNLARQPERGLPAAVKLAEALPDSAGAQLLLAASQAANKHFSTALEVLRQLRDHPGLTEMETVQAGSMAANTLHDLPLAQHFFSRATVLNPQNLGAQIQLAKINRLSGQRTTSDAALEQAAAIDPGHYEVLAERAEHLLLDGKVDQALTTMRQAYDRHSGWAYLKARLAEILIMRNQVDEAKQLAEELAAERAPQESAMGHTVLAQIYLSKQLYPDAVTHAEAAIQEDGSHFRQFTLLAQAQFGKGSYIEAREALDKAIALEPELLELRLTEAQIDYAEKSLTNGLARLEAIAVEPELPATIVLKLASLAFSHRQYAPAREWFLRLLAQNPKEPVATHGLVQCNGKLGVEPERTLALAKELARRFPESLDFAMSYAESLADGKPTSLAELEKLTAQFAFNPQAHYFLGTAYFKARRFADARKELEETLKMAPRYPKGPEIRAMLDQMP
ncbi:MAG: tetratricopeptide (TPR) repeat protein [Kiritimatiellia bacterium]|jgi:tetratricopeptide (TPR) repeat protein